MHRAIGVLLACIILIAIGIYLGNVRLSEKFWSYDPARYPFEFERRP